MLRCLAVVLTAVVVTLSGCGTGTTTGGSGGTVSAPPPPASGAGATREVRGFSGVELNAIGTLQIEQTGTESLTIEADPDVLARLTSDVSGGVLRLGPMPGTTLDNARPIVYRLTVATLGSIAVSGAGEVTATGLSTDRLAVDVAGAGDVTLSGTADTQVVTINGGGDYDAENLRSTAAEVAINGAGDVVVQVSDRLDVRIEGAGSVVYVGNPQVTQQIRGVGSVERR